MCPRNPGMDEQMEDGWLDLECRLFLLDNNVPIGKDDNSNVEWQ